MGLIHWCNQMCFVHKNVTECRSCPYGDSEVHGHLSKPSWALVSSRSLLTAMRLACAQSLRLCHLFPDVQ